MNLREYLPLKGRLSNALYFDASTTIVSASREQPCKCTLKCPLLYYHTLFRILPSQVGPGNNDMDTARALQSDHPEVVMFGRRCLGDAAGLYAKAKTFADAGNDEMAVKVRAVRRALEVVHVYASRDSSLKRRWWPIFFFMFW